MAAGRNNMIKAVFFDIDGTLISWDTRTIPASVFAALDSLREKGILCFVATGRSRFEIEAAHLLDGLCFDGYLLNNGQLATDGQGRAFFSTPIDAGDLDRLLQWVDARGVSCWMVSAEESAINHADAAARKALSDISTPLPRQADLRRLCRNPVYKFSLFLPPEELPMALLPHCSKTQWHAFGHDIFSSAGGKEQAFLATLKHFGLNAAECMAFGDSDNDAGLLRAAGIGVAMAESSALARSAADFVTRDCNDDGILFALRRFAVL